MATSEKNVTERLAKKLLGDVFAQKQIEAVTFFRGRMVLKFLTTRHLDNLENKCKKEFFLAILRMSSNRNQKISSAV
jgi:hypothetical protein